VGAGIARLLATALAVIGLYGVMAFVVTRRTKELGVRLALGAQRRSVIWLVMKEVLTLVAIGLIVGVPSAMGLGRVKKMKETQMRIEN
jgi:ABC-type antimicrobial peptide transport system permease subunit